MRSIASILIHLYPTAWRQRYGDEFEALLEDRPPTLSSLFDLVKGAIKMQLSLPTFPKLALLLSVTGLLAGFGISYLVTPTYISEATIMTVQTPGSTPADLRPILGLMQQEALSRTSLSSIIQDPRLDLYQSERAREPLEDVIETMRNRDVRIRMIGLAANTMEVSFAYSDRTKAHDTVQTLITRFQEINLTRQRNAANVTRQRSYDKVDRLEARIASLEKRLGISPSAPASEPEPFDRFGPGGVNMDVLDPPSLPINPVKPNRSVFAFFGFGSGIFMALVVAIFRRRAQPAIPFPTVPA